MKVFRNFAFFRLRTLWPPLLTLELLTQVVIAQNQPDIIWSTNAHDYWLLDVTFSQDGTLLASGSADRTAKIWRVTDGTLVRTFSSSARIMSLDISPDRTLLGVGDDYGKARVWRMADGTQLWVGGPNDDIAFSVAFSPDGALFGIGRTDGINVRNSFTGVGLPFNEPDGEVYDVCFSPDGSLLASANQNHNASLWRVPEGSLIRDLVGHSDWVTSVDFSPDGALLATASGDGTARLWQVEDGTEVRVIEGGGGSKVYMSFGAAKFSADGKILLTSSNGAIRFWRVSDGRPLLSYSNTGAGPIAVSPDGNNFAYGQSFQAGPGGTLFLARMPLLISEVERTKDDLRIDWQGGAGWYQVQQTTSLTSGVWMNIGPPTSGTSTNVPITSTNTFYRIQGLTNAP